MVTDQQVRRFFTLLQTENSQAVAAVKAGLSVQTARKYQRLRRLPSEVASIHDWRTREDPFAEVWEELRQELTINPGLQAKTLFQALQRRYPGRFQDGGLRTLRRRIKTWRALEGPAKEVFFSQVHEPGRLCQSDFTHLTELGVTVAGQPFDHMIYHFVLTYSNWEHGTVCFSESFESLAEGLQNALWALGFGLWAVLPPSIARIGSVRRSTTWPRILISPKSRRSPGVIRHCWNTMGWPLARFKRAEPTRMGTSNNGIIGSNRPWTKR
jgi:hypothetical protein